MRLTWRRADGAVCPRVEKGTDIHYIAGEFTQKVYDKLAAYEDTGFEPDEIDFCLSGAISPQEAKERYEAHKKRYDEWFAWKQAEEQGMLVPVVRCADCKWFQINMRQDGYLPKGVPECECRHWCGACDPTDFCSYGMRMDGDA